MPAGIHHVSLGTNDMDKALAFYDPVLKTVGLTRVMEVLPYGVGYGAEPDHPIFWIGKAHDDRPTSAGNGVHVGFFGGSKAEVDAFHAAALKHGGSDDGAPGPRPDYGPHYYGAFVRDPDGNKIEACLHQ